MPETIRFDINCGHGVPFGERPPVVWFTELPPLPGETTIAYHARAKAHFLSQTYAAPRGFLGSPGSFIAICAPLALLVLWLVS